MSSVANTDEKQGHRWQPGESGNPNGRPSGSRNKITLACEELLEGEAESVTRKCIELAQNGDMTAIRICMERIVPVRKGRSIAFDLPKMETADEIVSGFNAVFAGIAAGDITPDEAAVLAGVLELKRKALETMDFEKRLAAVEGGRR